jgi:hypothetical protein
MNAAVITETRPLSSIQDVIYDHLEMLPNDFELIVFCGANNLRYFNNFNCRKYTVNVNNLNDYNRLMTSMFFWEKLLAYERVLIFQTDSKILRSGIEAFYEWDYIGSPWKFQHKGGNGGLSLRSPKESMKTIKKTPYSPILGYEDVYFSNHMENIAPRSECEKFSCETIYKLGTWGYHAIKNYLTKEQIYEVENQYQESGRLAS